MHSWDAIEGLLSTILVLHEKKRFRVQPCSLDDDVNHIFTVNFPHVVCPRDTYSDDGAGFSIYNGSCKLCPYRKVQP